MAQPFVLSVDLQVQKVLGLANVKEQLAGLSINTDIGSLQQASSQLKSIGNLSSSLSSNLNTVAQAFNNLNKSASAATSSIANTEKVSSSANKSMTSFSDSIFLAGKRYAAFVLATGVAFKAVGFLSDAVNSTLEFESALTRLDQILDQGSNRVANLKKQFLELSTATGTSASDLTEVATILAQAGLGDSIDKAIEPLARIPLLPAFKDIKGTTEGLIAVFNQFGLKAEDTSRIIDQLNEVANKFAVTSEDVIEGVKRGGAAFASTGGSLEEFIQLFTTIRQVTQLSAETVGTAIKTISSRIFQPSTQSFLSKEGISTTNALTGEFVGLNNILLQVADKFNSLSVPRQQEFARQLGGIRQIGQILAAVRNPQLFEQVGNALAGSSGSAQRDAAKALETTSKQLDILAAKANELIQTLAPTTIIPFIKALTELGTAAVSVAGALSPLLPLLTSLAVFAAGKGLAGLASTLGSKLLGGGGLGSKGLLGPNIESLLFNDIGNLLNNNTAERIQRRLQGQLGGPGTPSVSGRVGQTLQNNPLLGVAGTAIFGTIAAQSLKTETAIDILGKESAETASNIVQFSTSLLTAIALLRGQSITGAIKGLVSGIGGALGGGVLGGTLAIGGLAGIVAGAAHASALNDTIDELLNQAIESIRKTDFTKLSIGRTGLDRVQQQLGLIAEKFTISEGFKEINRFNIGEATSGIDAIRRFSDNFFTLLTSLDALKAGFQGVSVTEFKQAGAIKQFVEANLGQLTTLFENAAKENIGNAVNAFSAGLQKREGVSPEIASRITEEFEKQIGGESALNARAESVRVQDQSIKEFERIQKQLISIVLPTNLTGQLLQFSKAVQETTDTINSSQEAFNAQINTIQGINPRSFNIQNSPRQIEGLIRSGSANSLFGDLQGIPQFISNITDVKDLIQKFAVTISSLPNDTGKAIDLENEIRSFIDQQNIPNTAKQQFLTIFNQVGEELNSAISSGFVSPDDVKKLFEEKFKTLGLSSADAIVNNVGAAIQNIFSQIQDRTNRLATIRRLEVQSNILPESQSQFLTNQFERAGVGIGVRGQGSFNQLRGTFEQFQEETRRRRTGVSGVADATINPPENFFEDFSSRLADVVLNEGARKNLTDRLVSVTDEITRLRSNLQTLTVNGKGSGDEFLRSTARLEQLEKQSIELQTTFEALRESTDAARKSQIEELALRQQIQKFNLESNLQQRVGEGGISSEDARRQLFALDQQQIKERSDLDRQFQSILQDDAQRRLQLAQIVDKNTQTQFDAANIQLSAAKIFQSAVLPLTGLNQSAIQSLDIPNNVLNINPEQVRSGAISQDELFKAINDTNNALGSIPANILGPLIEAFTEAENRRIENNKNIESQISQGEFQGGIPNIDELIGEITGLTAAIKEPGSLKINADQKIVIDVAGISNDIVTELTDSLRGLATKAASIFTRRALDNLSSRVDTETSIAIQGTVKDLE